MALYDISSATEEPREIRDIRDALKTIGRVFENQEAILQGWRMGSVKEDSDSSEKTDLHRSKNADHGSIRKADYDLKSTPGGLEKLGDEAGRIENLVTCQFYLKLYTGANAT